MIEDMVAREGVDGEGLWWWKESVEDSGDNGKGMIGKLLAEVRLGRL